MRDASLIPPQQSSLFGRFQATLAFIQASSEPSLLLWLASIQLVLDSRKMCKLLRSSPRLAAINNSSQYASTMHLIDALEANLDSLNKILGQKMAYSFLRRTLVAQKKEVETFLAYQYTLIQPFEWPADKPLYFQRDGQRAIWKRRNKAYPYLDQLPLHPNVAGVLSSLPD
jgi:hypothetical protein